MRFLFSLLLTAFAVTAVAAAQGFEAGRPLPGDLGLELAAGAELENDLATGDDSHLAVWVDGRTNLAQIASTNGYALGKSDVFARRIGADGAPLGPAFIVASMPFEARRPRVAWNGVDRWLVVWEVRRSTQTTTYVGIRGVRIHEDGTRLDTTPFVIDDDHGVDERFADVTGSNGEWIACWQDLNLLAGAQNVRAAVIAADGTVGIKKTLQGSTSGLQAPGNPSIAAIDDRFLVVWTRGGNYGVYGRMFDRSLDSLGAEFPLGNQSNFYRPHVATDGARFLVTWNGDWAAVVNANGSVVPPGGTQLAIAFATYQNEVFPTWMGDRWVVTGTNLDGHVLVEELDAQGQTIQSGILYDRGGRTRNAVCGAIGGAGVVTWSDDEVDYADMACADLGAGLLSTAVHPLGAGHVNQVQVDIDGDPQRGYFVTWLDVVSGSTRVMVQRVDGAGAPIDLEPRVVYVGQGEPITRPRIALGQTEAVVAWSGRDVAGFPGIFVKRLDLNAVPFDVQPIQVLPGSMADVDFEGGTYLVVGTHEPTNHFRPVIATRFSPAGMVLDPPYLQIGSSYSRFPRIGSTGGKFLVAYSRYLSHDSPYASTRAILVLPDGTLGATISVENAPNSTYGPIVAAGTNEFLVTFHTDGDSRARVVGIDGTPQGGPAGFALSLAPNAQFGAPAVPLATGWLAAWTDYRAHPLLEAGLGDVYAGRYDAAGNRLDGDGVAVSASAFIDGDAALAGANGDALLAYVGWSESMSAMRVHFTRFRDDLVGTRLCSPAAANSTGSFASVDATGSDVAFANDVELSLRGAPAFSFGYFLTSETQGFAQGPGGSQGNLCLGGTIARFAASPFQTSPSGGATFRPNLSSIPLGPGIPVFPGETWTFQAWFRDANPNVTSNFSDAIAIRFR